MEPGNTLIPDLIAPCGMNCAICSGYLAYKNDVKNKGVRLPALAVSVAHRSDGSGTTFVFTDYLTKASPEWKEKVGANKSPNWK